MTAANTRCPYCGRVNDLHAHTADPQATPQHGDVSVCWKCHGLALFVVDSSGLSVRMPTDDERTQLEANPEIRRAIAAIRESYRPSQAISLLRR